MPMVGNKKYPYTDEGKDKAKKAMKKKKDMKKKKTSKKKKKVSKKKKK
jgi:hypothetical protein|tara:strand:- start:1361 stop:1504 length:144 start_codon:yes stop_codon:yes gene_type:complete